MKRKTKAVFDKDGYSDDLGEMPDEKYLSFLDEDILPSPREIANSLKITKMTMSLTNETLEFFKHQAKKYGTQYQKMIREVLDNYVMMTRLKSSIK